MTDGQWKEFFLICTKVLGSGDPVAGKSNSWCAWTTFERLSEDADYWTAGLPRECDIGTRSIADGGVWAQPFSYAQIAHVLVPAKFIREIGAGTPQYRVDKVKQDLEMLSAALHDVGVAHRKAELVLEIERY
jgi:hypothetical protein